MSDHLLRLARIVLDVAYPAGAKSSTVEDALALVRDLEAAPPPERRTIAREEYHRAISTLSEFMGTDKAWHHEAVRRIAAVWRLTVED